ncbi:DUF4279 domain-containing protein [Sphingobacterium sp. SRCM116780]|uniref:DUF4279 domain-containing protein n=1 Tax=Sphingobacterium sp. SRCM116780 TaxID=2907623 RepID=UPI001F463216|nr:DUF4279 domain-containing protein [Sphingobacterium sp. SRCM116780]UIR55057.1 DUF4279 domain-containing protein [Sphingobacterium sp. SRCM116780]
MKHDLSLRFCIWQYEDVTHEEITSTLGLLPYKVYVKGEHVYPQYERLAKDSGWIYGTPYNNPDDFVTQMDKILDALEPKIPILREYAEKYHCEFSCAIFINNKEESAPRIYLDKRYNAFIREVNAIFDVEIYTPDLDDEEE